MLNAVACLDADIIRKGSSCCQSRAVDLPPRWGRSACNSCAQRLSVLGPRASALCSLVVSADLDASKRRLRQKSPHFGSTKPVVSAARSINLRTCGRCLQASSQLNLGSPIVRALF
jgi:hypothetical protein